MTSRDAGEDDADPGPQTHPPRPPPPPPAPTAHRVAAAQLTSTADADANFAAVSRLAQAALAAGASTLFLPEAFSFLGATPADTVAAAEPLETGARLQRYRALAASTGLWLTGCVPEAGAPPGPGGRPRCWNTHVVIDGGGRIVSAYRKVHLFDAEGLRESASTAPGGGGGGPVVAAGAPCGPIGLTVCFDLRFPAFFDALQYGNGRGPHPPPPHPPPPHPPPPHPPPPRPAPPPPYAARVIAVPSAFTVQTGAAHWDVLLRARAVETQAAIVAAAQAGEHAPGGRRSYGHTAIVSAWGEVLARVGGADAGEPVALASEGLAIADLTPATVEDVRARMPLADARARGRAALGWD